MLANLFESGSTQSGTVSVLSEDFIRSKIVMRGNKACVEGVYCQILRSAIEQSLVFHANLGRNPSLLISVFTFGVYKIITDVRKIKINREYRDKAVKLLDDMDAELKKISAENPDDVVTAVTYIADKATDNIKELQQEYEERYKNILSF